MKQQTEEERLSRDLADMRSDLSEVAASVRDLHASMADMRALLTFLCQSRADHPLRTIDDAQGNSGVDPPDCDGQTGRSAAEKDRRSNASGLQQLLSLPTLSQCKSPRGAQGKSGRGKSSSASARPRSMSSREASPAQVILPMCDREIQFLTMFF